MADALALLVGGAIGFVSAVLSPIVGEPIRNWLLGPKVVADFRDDDPSFLTSTIERYSIEGLDESKNYVAPLIEARYLRIRTRNTGRQIAMQCRAFLVEVEMWNHSNCRFEPTIYCDSIQLAWSARGGRDESFEPIDLPPKITQFVDLLSTRENSDSYRMALNYLITI